MNKSHYSPYQFAVLRIVLGCFLFVHFVMLLPYSTEIFSSAGVLPSASLNHSYPFFPDILYGFDSPAFLHGFIAGLAILALAFALGIFRRLSAFLLWYGWACLFNRNNLIANPGLPFVGWLLLVCAAVPLGEPWALFRKPDKRWSLHPALFWGAWIIMSLGYSLSGLHKMGSPSWWNGTALVHLLNNPLSRDTSLRSFMQGLPLPLLRIMCWSILASEVLFAPLAAWKKTRPLAFVSMVAMHLGILVIVDFADLTMGVLMMHVFTFDSRWLKPFKK